MTENKWQLSARACSTTLMASVAGGWVALVQSYLMHDKKQEVRLVPGPCVIIMLVFIIRCSLSSTASWAPWSASPEAALCSTSTGSA